jgi:hypothetical protein
MAAEQLTSGDYGDFERTVRSSIDEGDLFGAFSLLSEAGVSGPERPALAYLEVLCLARMGDTDEAIRRFGRYALAGLDQVDVLALDARLLKDKALAETGPERPQLLARAADRYAQAAAATGNAFPLINAATLAWLAGHLEVARQRARAVADDIAVKGGSDYWALATRAEAELLLGLPEQALASLAQALASPGASIGARSSTLRQFCHLLPQLALNPTEAQALLDQLRPPPVIHFCGHIFREHPAAELGCARRIDAVYDRLGVQLGCGALAAGADILLAERLLARGGELHVVLPFAQDAFVEHSVAPAGTGWIARFERCLAAAASVTCASEMDYIGDDRQFSYGAIVAMGIARLRARHIGAETRQVAIWDGLDVIGEAGTAADVRRWREAGGEALVINPGLVDRNRCRPTASPEPARRAIHAILFTDFAGFSKLSEPALPLFWRTIMEQAGQALARHKSDILAQNSWGDAVFAVITDAAAAARIALDLQQSLDPEPIRALEPRAQGMRIALHYGTMFAVDDPITGRPNYYGTEVSRAARLEPVTPPNSVYATEPFAAVLVMQEPKSYELHYAGRIRLAKNYGTHPVYRLSRAAERYFWSR